MSSIAVASGSRLTPLSCGLGEEGHGVLAALFEEAREDFLSPLSRDRMDSERLFEMLAQQWLRDTAFTSSATRMAQHPAYQQIIGMGEKALGPLFRELARRPDHWFWALTAITGADPVPRSARGNVELMAAAWLAWGRNRRYVV